MEKLQIYENNFEFIFPRYDRETSVFTPPKNSSMSIWVTSLLTTSEILNMILEKYQITSDQENYGLFLVKDSGGKYFF